MQRREEHHKTAWNQGVCQADSALENAKSVGFDGSIIYIDIENANTTASGFQEVDGKRYSCHASIEAYLSGFVAEMHKQGSKAGIYGSAVNFKPDFANEGTDAAYIAQASKDIPFVTVWSLGNKSYKISDSLWPSKQRIHQYSLDIHETWGNQRLKLDADLVDAPIVNGGSDNPKAMPSFDANTTSVGSVNAVIEGINDGFNSIGQNDPGHAVPETVSVAFNEVDSDGFGILDVAKGVTGIKYPKAVATIPTGINNQGLVVGYYCPKAGCNPGRGFIYNTKTNKFADLNVAGSVYSELYGINDAGWIVGQYAGTDGVWKCVLFKPTASGSYQTIPFSEGQSQCHVSGINGIGIITGTQQNDQFGQSYSGYVIDAESGDPNDARVVQLPALNAIVQPMGINNNSIIVGNQDNDSNPTYQTGFVLDFLNPSTQTTVQIPGMFQSALYGINDKVELVGWDYVGGPNGSTVDGVQLSPER